MQVGTKDRLQAAQWPAAGAADPCIVLTSPSGSEGTDGPHGILNLQRLWLTGTTIHPSEAGRSEGSVFDMLCIAVVALPWTYGFGTYRKSGACLAVPGLIRSTKTQSG